ncbi:MAG: NotI family restriction endonuclease [candidate division WOR-3 bacterium]|nr:NotI family restriction endonuclease [candidate division WOR-3 bacterium]
MRNSSSHKNPLAEVFGFPVDDMSDVAHRHRRLKLCPFNNKVPNCTKDKANDPLGVCSIYHNNHTVITCPVRFREHWIIAEDAASFFFGDNANWTSLTEVKLEDKNGQSAGNIDIVLVAYDEAGKVIDFGSLEVQGVYISGNIRRPFETFVKDPSAWRSTDWGAKASSAFYPKPDYLSSSRKRLVPQMLYKGGILKAWGRKQAVALQKSFFETLPELPRVGQDAAEIAWFLYDLQLANSRYELKQVEIVYTEYWPALNIITTPEPGDMSDFISVLQNKLTDKLDNPPDTPTITDVFLQ